MALQTSMNEDEATMALQQLEAASAFVGLRLNVPKTEVLAKGIKKPNTKPTLSKAEALEQGIIQARPKVGKPASSPLLMTMVYSEAGKWKLKTPNLLELKKN